MTRAFVDPPRADPDPSLRYCQDCQQHYWVDLGHGCDARMSWRGPLVGLALMLAASVLVVLPVLLAAGVVRWWPLP